MAVDAAGSVGAIVAGLAVVIASADWVDPVASILIGFLVLWSAWSLLRDTTAVLLESAPKGLDPQVVETALRQTPTIADVHHVHIWAISSETTALSGHVVLVDDPRLHEAQARALSLKQQLADDFGIEHATLEMEYRDCSADHGVKATADH